jgi:hypothetical protein
MRLKFDTVATTACIFLYMRVQTFRSNRNITGVRSQKNVIFSLNQRLIFPKLGLHLLHWQCFISRNAFIYSVCTYVRYHTQMPQQDLL